MKENKSLKFYASEKAEVNETERSIVSYVSTKDIDRDGEIVIPQGIDLNNFQKNPIVLWNHMSWGDKVKVIGKSLWQKADAKGLISKTEFAKTELASEVYELMKEGFLTSWSIGFKVLDWEDVQGVRTFTKTELLEYSAVAIPANPEAVNLNFIKGLKTGEMKEAFSAKYLLESVDKEINDLKIEIAGIKNSGNDGTSHADMKIMIDEAIVKQVKDLQPKFNDIIKELNKLKAFKNEFELKNILSIGDNQLSRN